MVDEAKVKEIVERTMKLMEERRKEQQIIKEKRILDKSLLKINKIRGKIHTSNRLGIVGLVICRSGKVKLQLKITK